MFPFSIIRMSCLDSNIPSNINIESIGSEILWLARTAPDVNYFATLSNPVLKRMQNEGTKHKFILYMLNNIFSKHVTVFNVFADIAVNFIIESFNQASTYFTALN